MTKLTLSIVLMFLPMVLNAQNYNKEWAEASGRIQHICLQNLAPPGGKVQKDPYIYDVAKEKCLCFTNSVMDEKINISKPLTSAQNHRLTQIQMQCADHVLKKREPEALASYNKYLATRNLPIVTRFHWYYWFN